MARTAQLISLRTEEAYFRWEITFFSRYLLAVLMATIVFVTGKL